MSRIWDYFRPLAGPPKFALDERLVWPPRDKPSVQRALGRRAPSREAFRAWRDDHVTQFAFGALAVAAAEQQKAWTDVSWQSGDANAELLLELRTRADAYKSLQEADYEAFCQWLGVEPLPEEKDAAA